MWKMKILVTEIFAMYQTGTCFSEPIGSKSLAELMSMGCRKRSPVLALALSRVAWHREVSITRCVTERGARSGLQETRRLCKNVLKCLHPVSTNDVWFLYFFNIPVFMFFFCLSAVYKEESAKNYFLRRSSRASQTRTKMTANAKKVLYIAVKQLFGRDSFRCGYEDIVSDEDLN